MDLANEKNNDNNKSSETEVINQNQADSVVEINYQNNQNNNVEVVDDAEVI